MRRTPLKPARMRVAGRSRNPMPPSVAEAVIARAAGACEACRFVLREKGHLHHRKLRSQGGKHTVENLVLVHTACHDAIHLRNELSYQLGLLVRSWLDPADVPVRTFGSTIWDTP
jgi:5-methylcytosine-specific restriction endonuclease McrA